MTVAYAPTMAPGFSTGLLRLLSALAQQRVEVDPPAGERDIDLAAVRGRDPRAWRRFVEAEMSAIYRYMMARCGDPTDAEDLTSQAFEEAWKAAGSLQDLGLPPRAWLFGVARNVVNSHRRRLFRRPPHLSLEAYDSPGHDSALSTDLLDLARAIDGLSRDHAEIVTLRFVHGLSVEEAAAVLELTPGAVRGRQFRALAALREKLAP